jgi:peptidoglycan hydrolase-like protein with peptidoglycan-binding domain
MANPGQPTIGQGAIGTAVRRLQRALRRTPNHELALDGVFGPQTGAAVREFQREAGLAVDGIVGPQTWQALPDGAPMPTLCQGARGNVVVSLQRVLTNGAAGLWGVTPQGIDGDFGPHTLASVRAFQEWGNVATDGVVGDLTWSVSLHAMNSTLESATGLLYVAG